MSNLNLKTYFKSGTYVSTIRLPMAFFLFEEDEGYETMIFGGQHNNVCYRVKTEENAWMAHIAVGSLLLDDEQTSAKMHIRLRVGS